MALPFKGLTGQNKIILFNVTEFWSHNLVVGLQTMFGASRPHLRYRQYQRHGYRVQWSIICTALKNPSPVWLCARHFEHTCSGQRTLLFCILMMSRTSRLADSSGLTSPRERISPSPSRCLSLSNPFFISSLVCMRKKQGNEIKLIFKSKLIAF